MPRKPRSTKAIGRKRRALGWTLLTLGLLVAAVSVASRWLVGGYTSSQWKVGINSGVLSVYRLDEGTGFPSYWSSGIRVPEARQLRWWYGFSHEPGEHVSRRYAGVAMLTVTQSVVSQNVGIMLWPLPPLLWTPAALLLRSGILARRRAVKGMCAKCGYSLAGLAPDAPCPECGTVRSGAERMSAGSEAERSNGPHQSTDEPST